jgi:hypothetical protein
MAKIQLKTWPAGPIKFDPENIGDNEPRVSPVLEGSAKNAIPCEKSPMKNRKINVPWVQSNCRQH